MKRVSDCAAKDGSSVAQFRQSNAIQRSYSYNFDQARSRSPASPLFKPLVQESLRAGMERHVEGRRRGFAPHLAHHAGEAVFPGNLLASRSEAGAYLVDRLGIERGVRIKRPAAVIDAGRIG